MTRQQQVEQRKAIVERYYKLVDANDFVSLFDLFTEDIEYERGNYPTIVGIEAFRQFYYDERTIASGAHTIDDMLVGDDSIATRGRFQGTLRDGRSVTLEFSDFHQFRGAKICRRYTYFRGVSA